MESRDSPCQLCYNGVSSPEIRIDEAESGQAKGLMNWVNQEEANMQWSEKQKEAIQDRGHNLLVSAAAGSGKTAVLVERIKGLLLEDKVQLNQMLIVTFSNAAAAEMREKIANALQAEMEREDCDQEKRRYLRGQLNSMHKANISTESMVMLTFLPVFILFSFFVQGELRMPRA